MKKLLLLIAMLALPATLVAQTHSAAPMVVVGEGAVVAAPAEKPADAPAKAAEAPAPATVTAASPMYFPDSAVTNVDKTVPAPAGSAAANAAATPAEKHPASKAWPKDAAQIFMNSCVRMHVEYYEPCHCIITQLMERMGHDEFMALNENGTLEKDQRLISIRQACVTKPRERK